MSCPACEMLLRISCTLGLILHLTSAATAFLFHAAAPPNRLPRNSGGHSRGSLGGFYTTRSPCARNIHRLQAQTRDSDEKEEEAISADPKWQVVSDIITLENPWLTIKGERLLDDRNQLLDYWRVEKADSVIVLALHHQQLVFPKPMYRVGVDRVTLDFAGGRLPRDFQESPIEVVPHILQRELGVSSGSITRVHALSGGGSDAPERDSKGKGGWPINSSFSNQKLLGFVAELDDDCVLDPALVHLRRYETRSKDDLNSLLEDLVCLQCRAVLMEWMLREGINL